MYGPSFVALFNVFVLAFGDRLNTRKPDKSLKALVPDTTTICGEPEIWRKLTENPTVDGVQNINWLKIDKTIEDRVHVQSSTIASLESEIAGLEERIAAAKKGEEAGGMSAEDVTKLITDGLAAFAGEGAEVGGLESAKQSLCGKPGVGPAPRGAHRESQKLFAKEAKTFFEGGKVRCSQDFLAQCRGMLPMGEGPFDSYCPRLCQRFKDVAQELSDSFAGETAGSASADLVKQQKEKMDELTQTKEDLSSCQQARSFIISLGKEISEGKKVVDVRFENYQDAEMRLYDANWELEDLGKQLEKEQAALEEAMKVLDQSGADVSAVEASLTALKDEISGTMAELAETSEKMREAEVKLNAAKEADTAVVGLKDAVSVTTVKMRMLFTKAVLDPMTKVGLSESASLDKLPKEVLQKLTAAEELDEQLDTLAGYCEGEGKEAFAAVKEELNFDLGGLCNFQPAPVVFNELQNVVLSKRADVDKTIKQLQTWFNPLKGQSEMTKERVAEFVSLGEPQGLREIVGVFQPTNFFRKYLKEWQLKGRFPRLIAQLKEVVSSADSAFGLLKSQVEDISAKLGETEEKRKQAQENLEAAIAKQGQNKQAKEALEQTVSTLSEGHERMKEERSQFEEELRLALEKWEESKAQLLEAHKQATSLAESWAEGQSFDVLDVAVRQARRELALVERALAVTEAEAAAIE